MCSILDLLTVFVKCITNLKADGLCFLWSNSLAVVVEDSSSSCCVTVKVFPHMTTAVLKQQVSLKNVFFQFFIFAPWNPYHQVFSLSYLFYHHRCSLSMASTHGCSAGWLVSACAPTSALWPRMVFVRMVTQLSCTCCQPATLAWHSRPSSRTRRVPSSLVLHLCPSPRLPSFLPRQMALHHKIENLTPPCPRDSIPAATLVSEGIN